MNALLKTEGTVSMKETYVKRLLLTLDSIKASSISNRLCRFWLNNARNATVKQRWGVEISGNIDKSQAARIWRPSNFSPLLFPYNVNFLGTNVLLLDFLKLALISKCK